MAPEVDAQKEHRYVSWEEWVQEKRQSDEEAEQWTEVRRVATAVASRERFSRPRVVGEGFSDYMPTHTPWESPRQMVLVWPAARTNGTRTIGTQWEDTGMCSALALNVLFFKCFIF